MRFNVRFNQTDQRLKVKFNSPSKAFSASFKGIQQVTVDPDVEFYTGDYEVTPMADAQTLATKEKLMADDVHIKAIPFFEVSNNSGGTTVYIGTLDDYPSKKAVLGKAKLGTMTL